MSEDDKSTPKESKILALIEADYPSAKGSQGRWRKTADECFLFAFGDQWDKRTRKSREQFKKPTLTFNIIKSMIKAISGTEINNRKDVKFVCRHPAALNPDVDPETKAKYKDVVEFAGTLTAANDLFRDINSTDMEDSHAFEDMLVGGLGFTDTYIDYDDDPQGTLKTVRVVPQEVYPDPAARMKNLTDARYFIRERYFSASEIKNLFPKDADRILATAKESMPTYTNAVIDRDLARKYQDGNIAEVRGSGKNARYVVQKYEWIEYEKRCLIQSAENPEERKEDLSAAEYALIKDELEIDLELGILEKLEYNKKLYKSCYRSGAIVWDIKTNSSFQVKAITGEYDHIKNEWFGPVRDLIDGQRMVNSMFSQAVHVVDMGAKGGYIAEDDAFEDLDEFSASINKSELVTIVNQGGLAKLLPKQVTGMPEGNQQLINLFLQMMPLQTGVNNEFLGAADRDQAGVLEYQRKQSALAILAPYFDVFNRYKVLCARYRMNLIIEDLSDGRYVKIAGPSSDKFVPLNTPEHFDWAFYDVQCEVNMNSPNSKQEQWSQALQWIPIAQAAGFPIPPEVIKLSPFSEDFIQVAYEAAGGKDGDTRDQLKQQLLEMQQQLQQATDQSTQLQQSVQELTNENSLLKLDMPIRKGELEIDKRDQDRKDFETVNKVRQEDEKLELEGVKTMVSTVSIQ